MSTRSATLLVAALALVLAACAKELPPDLAPGDLYRIGREAHAERNWQRAIDALQRFLTQDPGNPRSDSAQYLIADSYFNQKQYLTAAAEFLRLAESRPAASLADDSRYRACEAYAKLSPRPELDQEYTVQAIGECRSVRLLYPNSPYAEPAARQMQELTNKLARKVYLNADYYYRRKAYDSAIVYLEHLIENFRGAAVEPAALFRLQELYSRLGYSQEAEQARQRLLREYPDSAEAQRLRETTGAAGGRESDVGGGWSWAR